MQCSAVRVTGLAAILHTTLYHYTLHAQLHSFVLLSPWCRVLLEKLTGLQLVEKFPAFHGTPRFITALTSVRHLSLSWASPIQSIYPHTTSWRSILILSTHLCLGFPSGLFPSSFPTKTLYNPPPHPYALYVQPSSFVLLEKTNFFLLWNSKLWFVLNSSVHQGSCWCSAVLV